MSGGSTPLGSEGPGPGAHIRACGQSWLCIPDLSLSSAHLKDWWVKSRGVEARCSARMGRARWRDGRAF